MSLATGIRKHGFRKWYERELLHSHAHMLLTFICLIGVLAALEGSSLHRSISDQMLNLGTAALCTGVGIWALRRYMYLLMHAEAVANQADCPGCGTYARFTLVHSDPAGERVAVCCRACAHQWDITS